ncbi:MAG TPA: magnesium transporter [Bacillota bacterium]|nr:magnesium transporter [Bacillota bacterium]
MVKLNSKNREQYMNVIFDALQYENEEQFRGVFLDLHPSDQADMIKQLSKEQRAIVYTYIKPEEFALTFENFNIEDQQVFFSELDEAYTSHMFDEMFTDDVVYFLASIEDEKAEHIIDKMTDEKAEEIRVLLSYKEETAGSVMTKELVSISSINTVGNVIEQLREEAPSAEIIYYNYVVDEDHSLVGVVSLRDLITSSPGKLIKDVMSINILSVPVEMDQEDVANVIKKYDLLAVPVVDKHKRLLGIVTVDDIIDILEEETTEDFGEISGSKGTFDINISPLVAARKRSPWIITLMFFGLITGSVIGSFEETLEAIVLLAVFIPMIMDSAGNVGTQSLGVAVRGLALGTIEKGSFVKIIRRELSTGALIGLICMVLITALIALFYGNPILGLIVGVSILITLTVSAAIGAIVPLIIDKLNFDPAIASGPFITTLNDIIGLLIYFSIATALMDVI